jgi:DNA polymerase elongation subunit (family B)
MRILLLDIETAPNTAFVWGLFKQNVAINQIKQTSYVLCWSAKWLGEKDIFFSSVDKDYEEDMLKGIHELLDQADVVVHFNGTSFDIPTLNREFVLNGLPPPAPYKQVDLLKVAKDKFRFTSNKLDFIAQQFKLGKKHNTTFDLWVGCMDGDSKSWEIMEEYNKNDVVLLERLYQRFLPWISKHPNMAIYTNARVCCPNCGSMEHQRRGFHYTTVGRYQRYACKKCGNWFRDGTNRVPMQKEVMRNVA